MNPRPHKLIPPSFSPTPSRAPENAVGILVVNALSTSLDVVGVAVEPDGSVPAAVGVDFATLAAAGFHGEVGQTFLLPQQNGPAHLVFGVGAADARSASVLRDVSASFARGAGAYARIGIDLRETFALGPAVIGQMVAEGALLARYRYTPLKADPKHVPLVSLDVLAAAGDAQEVTAGTRRGEILARATNLARDLANTPPGHLTATDMGDVALEVGEAHGLDVEVFDKQQLIELGCGGLLGVNAGSVEEPRMIQLRYTPKAENGATIEPTGHLALVGKGIMYDSGGISLKPSDPMHLAMKMDMAGAAAVLGAMTALADLSCPTAVTAFLMCTDNMPSGSATVLGDVLTLRGGTTVEVKNTDAEGRLVLSDALVLASEEHPDAIVDIATLTGAALMALGTKTAAVIGNDQGVIDRAVASSKTTDEGIWQLPLERSYRKQLDSDVADISNMGGKYAGATIAALFLADFVGDTPWAHLDIAGTMQVEADESWRPKGATGFGTRLLVDLAETFTK
ncbi:leucyl aminopeptidase [Plantibacter sp. YIM 135249]|uniref:leucyl aminopeptidase n=1 Tax=Plantibacter sp. YIM 135249 TaxID=3423918 RepID=UPI003D355CCE